MNNRSTPTTDAERVQVIVNITRAHASGAISRQRAAQALAGLGRLCREMDGER